MSGTAFCLAQGLFRLNSEWRVKAQSREKAMAGTARVLERAQLARQALGLVYCSH